MPHKTQVIKRVREVASEHVQNLNEFDYDAPAELFPRSGKRNRGQVSYKRFDTAAEAIRFAIEEIHSPALLSACLQVKEARFELREIGELYESEAYPLKRHGKKSAAKQAAQLDLPSVRLKSA
jgi:hypothetical protein